MKFTYILCFSFASFARPGFINRILKRDDTSDFQDIMLTTHNNDRATHGVSALTWSSELESQANSYASQCEWQHSGTNGVGKI